MTSKMSQSGFNIFVCQNIIVIVCKGLKPLFLDPCFNTVNSHASNLFVYLSATLVIKMFTFNDTIWASTQENLSSGVCEQHRRRPACESAQSGYRFLESIICKLATGEISNFLVSLCS